MAVPMPASMPCPLIEGHVQQEVDIGETCDFESGEARRASIYTSVPNVVQMAWRFESQAQFDAWFDWFESDLQAGALPFELPVAEQGGIDAIVGDALFLGSPRERLLPGGRWRVDAVCVTERSPGWNSAETLGATLSERGRLATIAPGGTGKSRALVGASTGRRLTVIEFVAGSLSAFTWVGVSRSDGDFNSPAFALRIKSGNADASTGASTGASLVAGGFMFGAGDRIYIWVDGAVGVVWLGLNGVPVYGDPVAGLGGNWSGLSSSVEWRPYVELESDTGPSQGYRIVSSAPY